SKSMRALVRENHVRKEDLIYPLFIIEGTDIKREVSSMPGVFNFSLDRLEDEINEIVDLGIQSVLLFGVPEHKDPEGSEAYHDHGIVQEA
ncbi:porphobilinogen synthase, partial [Streptococcus pneumoniae]|nr:porphobilinogen synthase [Streptococcus pneumoniae]